MYSGYQLEEVAGTRSVRHLLSHSLVHVNFRPVHSLVLSLAKALAGLDEAKQYFAAVEMTGSAEQRATWVQQMTTANEQRCAGNVSAMDVYLPDYEKGELY